MVLTFLLKGIAEQYLFLFADINLALLRLLCLSLFVQVAFARREMIYVLTFLKDTTKGALLRQISGCFMFPVFWSRYSPTWGNKILNGLAVH